MATTIMTTLLSLVLIYHLLIITEVISYKIAWGGRIETKEQMHVFEAVSILINLIFMAIILSKSKQIKLNKPSKLTNVFLWIIIVLFSLNTIGNLFSTNILETIIFTPLTLVSALLCYRIVIEKTVESNTLH